MNAYKVDNFNDFSVLEKTCYFCVPRNQSVFDENPETLPELRDVGIANKLYEDQRSKLQLFGKHKLTGVYIEVSENRKKLLVHNAWLEIDGVCSNTPDLEMQSMNIDIGKCLFYLLDHKSILTSKDGEELLKKLPFAISIYLHTRDIKQEETIDVIEGYKRELLETL